MTVWPNRLPAVSEVTGFCPYRLDGDLLKLDLDARLFIHEIPDELYLRELYELDTGDVDQVLEPELRSLEGGGQVLDAALGLGANVDLQRPGCPA